MASIVLELQQKAMHNQGSVADLLRLAYAVARKLRVEEFALWAKKELDGYDNIHNDLIPEYRSVRGRLQALNPYRGWIPAVVPDAEISKAIELTKLFEPVPELEHILSQTDVAIHKPIVPRISNTLASYFKFDTQFTLFISRSELEGILHHIRQQVLEWAIRLEEEGILGDGIQFSDEEKRTAQEQRNQLNITAPGANIQIQQDTTHSTQSMEIQQVDAQRLQTLTEQIRTYLDQTGLGESDKSEVLRELDTLSEQAQSGSPKSGVVSKSLMFIKGALEKAAGSMVASGLLHEIGKFMH